MCRALPSGISRWLAAATAAASLGATVLYALPFPAWEPREEEPAPVQAAASPAARRGCRVCSPRRLGGPGDAPLGGADSNGGPPEAQNALIVTIGDRALYAGDKLASAVASLSCYARRWGAPVFVLDPADVPECAGRVGYHFFFKRICTIAALLEGFSGGGNGTLLEDLSLTRTPTWLVFLDGDTLIYNLDASLLDFVDSDAAMIFYERFLTGEVVAGNWMARVGIVAAQFARHWESYARESQSIVWNNHDNGALHLALLRHLRGELGLSLAQTEYVAELWRTANSMLAYDRFVAAAKLLLGPERRFRDVLVHRRGLGFCFDNYWPVFAPRPPNVTGPPFLCSHGCKDEATCEGCHGRSCLRSLRESCASLHECLPSPEDIMVSVPPSVWIRRWEVGPVPGRVAIGLNDVRDCWPECAENISASEWPQLREKLVQGLGDEHALALANRSDPHVLV